MNKFLINKSIKMIVCDMAGTTVNEGGIVYKSLYETIKGYDIYINENDMKSWYGVDKREVLRYFINRDIEYKDNVDAILPQMLDSFKYKIKENYFEKQNVKLIDENLPDLFNHFRNNGIKIVLNSGFSKDIQTELVTGLNMDTFIDGYISSEEVSYGRPKPFMINEAMKRFNISNSNEVIKIGDSVYDILEGKNAKCHASIGVLSGADCYDILMLSGADKVLNSVMDLELEID